MKPALEKVTAFITRASESTRELLVFMHPSAGLQLPAGTVEPGESPDAAVLRETFEETGLHAVSIVEYLDAIEQPLGENDYIVVQRCAIQDSPGVKGTLRLGEYFERGHTVQVLSRNGGYRYVAYTEYRFVDNKLIAASSKTGWIAARFLTRRVQRHFFHLTPTEPTPLRWTVNTDGHQFTLFWVPLERSVGLIAPQQHWLDLVHDRL